LRVALPAESDRSKQLRVSDGERRDMVEVLRRHYQEGRLTLGEFEDRAGQAYQSRVYGDFDGLLADLPVLAGTTLPAPPAPHFQGPARRRALGDPGFRSHLGVYVVLSAFFIFLWAATTAPGHFWPMWPMSGWGIAVALHLLATLNGEPPDAQ
jgi:hypothetical protein